MVPDTPHPYPRLFVRATARLQRDLALHARRDVAVCLLLAWAEVDTVPCYDDVCYLAGYGLVPACPN